MNPITTPNDTMQPPRSRPGEPTWEVTEFFPRQGEWTEAEYLAFESNRLVELTDGRLEVLPMPTLAHQLIVKFLCAQLEAYLSEHAVGTVLFAPLPVRLGSRRYREPDIVYLSRQRFAETDRYPNGADLVMEVVSEGKEDRERDLEAKRREYAEAGIDEYWIVDPEQHRILVLELEGSVYREVSSSDAGEIATSQLLDGFTVVVDAAFRSGDPA